MRRRDSMGIHLSRAGLCAGMSSCVLAISTALAAPPLPPSVLVLDQSASLRPWSTAIIKAIQSSMSGNSARPISYYVEHLDLFDFYSPQYEDNLRNHFGDKYRDKPIDLILSIGPDALDLAVKLRGAVWPAVPIAFTAVDEEALPKNQLPPMTTGIVIRRTLATMVKAAQAVVPNLKRLALVGDRFEQHVYDRRFAEELPDVSIDFEIIDLLGLPVREVRQRVATLPADSVILYFGINADQDARYTSAVEVLPLIAEAANRPIIVDAETEIGLGPIGGFLRTPDQIGRDAGLLAMRILNGEAASEIPITVGNPLKPIFDWRQLQRWGIGESRLPPGNEIRFREPTAWERYHWQIVTIAAALFVQMSLIVGLFYERRRRRFAEVESRRRLSELAHMNRTATAGALSASIAHEIKQPLAAIAANGSAALRWLTRATPDLDEAKESMERVVGAAHRASDVIDTIRSMFKTSDQKKAALKINVLIEEVLAVLHTDFLRRKIIVLSRLSADLPRVMAHRVQLQQVILNLCVNAADAMDAVTNRDRVLKVMSERHSSGVSITVEDSGVGVEPKNIERIFEPFYTTKSEGMGMGLSICRSIIEEHGGRLSATSGRLHGLTLQISLPADNIGVPERDKWREDDHDNSKEAVTQMREQSVASGA
jgi:signal transduction histidine kinase